MVNIYFSRLLGCICMVSMFVCTALAGQQPLLDNEAVVDKDILFINRINNLVKAIKKCKKSGNLKKAVSALFEVKDEVEGFLGQRVELHNCFDVVIQELKNKGVKINSSEVKLIWKHINSKHKGEKHDEEVPVKLELGITIALCGLLLSLIPTPLTQTAGGVLMSLGCGLAGDCVVDRMRDEQEERERNNKM